MKRLAVFVSGIGSLLEAMIKDGLDIDLVLTDRECRGQDIAVGAGIGLLTINRSEFGLRRDFDRFTYTHEVTRMLRVYGIDFIAMAGFMTVLHPYIFKQGFKGRILNTHPALLPAFKGDHAVRDALACGVKVTGCTIHIATEELDAGKILAQEAVPVLPDDTEATLHERIKQVERVLYPRTIREFAETL
ncbi:MAG: phosphoribosylglycinamide formyltransferase [Candidatus Staskawiczbacteria bacterium]